MLSIEYNKTISYHSYPHTHSLLLSFLPDPLQFLSYKWLEFGYLCYVVVFFSYLSFRFFAHCFKNSIVIFSYDCNEILFPVVSWLVSLELVAYCRDWSDIHNLKCKVRVVILREEVSSLCFFIMDQLSCIYQPKHSFVVRT